MRAAMALSIQDAEILRTRVRALVTAELVERARAAPAPPYDPDIAEVLDFVRRNPDPDLPRYAIVRCHDGFAIAARAAVRGRPPELVDARRHPDRGAAEHAVLERRLRDLGLDW
ncbi:hypothetical protein D7319_23515 [Streptomyces radicis]|uniref:N,N-dimethylformamidase alpha subunit domain-containing protein n=2 Tax=Streptomyces radicis TaxID=1750517 RepID=A0A3A9WIK5_9ACTN|nr:hypothetical protein D7319_23515 [Streptomyces radicis]